MGHVFEIINSRDQFHNEEQQQLLLQQQQRYDWVAASGAVHIYSMRCISFVLCSVQPGLVLLLTGCIPSSHRDTAAS
jgi:hypothetical protein